MPLVIADRVRETTLTSGTGTLTLAGPYSGFQAFSVIGNGNTTYYAIIDAQNGAWEVGIGAYTSSGNTLSRATVLASSNAGSLVNFGTGTKDVILTQPARRSVLVQEGGSGLITGVAAFTANGVPYADSTSTLATSANMTFNGTRLTVADLADSGLTAGRVVYASTGGALVDSANLTFDGTNLAVANRLGVGGVTSPAYAVDVGDSAGGNMFRFSRSGTELGSFISGGTPFFGTLSNHPLAFTVNSSERMRLDASGNLGLGVTPSAWASSYKAYQVSTTASFHGAIDNRAAMASNYVETASGGRYINSDFASAYVQVQSQHRWFTAPSGTAGNAISFTQAMTLDASGNLGVGTTSPGQKLDIRSDTSGTSVRVSTSDNGNIVRMGWKTGVSFLAAEGYNSPVLAFETGGSERARIDSSGNLLVGRTSGFAFATVRLAVEHGQADYVQALGNSHPTVPYGIAMRYTAASPNNTGSAYIYADDSGGTQRFSVRSNGGVYNFSGNNSNLSDRREKTNFAPAKSYLETICAIPVQTFNYIDQNHEEDPGLTLGVVAQDVQAVAPELVMESNWGTKEEPKMRLSVYQTDLQYALMKCIQEQQALIQTLTARVAALESN